MIRLEELDPRVWHVNDPDCPEDAVYVGRPSEYGNDYSHLPRAAARYKVATREEAIRRFEESLTPELREKIKRELKGKHLKCWCAPKKCHADVIFRIANEKN